MKTFNQYIKEASLRQILKPIPQSPKHHAEGDVFVHTLMVRSRLPLAVDFVQKEKLKTDSIFSNLDVNLNPSQIRILKLAAWFHDIGKASANKIKVMNWNVNYWKKLDSTAIKILLLAIHLKYFYFKN